MYIILFLTFNHILFHSNYNNIIYFNSFFALVNKIINEVPHISIVETVDSLKLAKKLNTAIEQLPRDSLDIYIQVHTSNEETKSGVPPEELPELVAAIVSECKHISIKGVMTIGEPNNLNCFDILVNCRYELLQYYLFNYKYYNNIFTRSTVADALKVDPKSLALSMGMSGDFVEAIERGSTSVRVGSSLFGERDYSKK
jgi:uncharacterized pyridoxal phosphate-containing UPF0001 family protein